MRRYAVRVDKSLIILCLTLLGATACASTNGGEKEVAVADTNTVAEKATERVAEPLPDNAVVDVANDKQVIVGGLTHTARTE